MSFPNPATLLKDAIGRVPELKWALAVGGLVSVVAIVTSGWKIPPLSAVLSVVVMLVLMTALVVFAKLSSTAAEEFKNAIRVLMWASLCLTIGAAVLLFTSAFFSWPLVLGASPGPASEDYRPAELDPRVWDLEEQVNTLRGTWETVAEYGEGTRKEVLERATKLAQDLTAVDDPRLGPSGHLIKREFTCYALIMAADTETNNEKKAATARQALGWCKSAADDLGSIFKNSTSNKNLAYTSAWARKQDQEPFVGYLSAMAQCLEGLAGNDKSGNVAVKQTLDLVPTYYLDRYPPARDSILKHCLEK